MNSQLRSIEDTKRLQAEGLAAFQQRDFLGALNKIDRFLSTKDGTTHLYNIQARALEALGRHQEALTSIEKCLALDPSAVDEHCNRALILAKLNRLPDALGSLDTAIGLQPRNSSIWIKRAHLLHQLNKREEALGSAQRAVDVDPKSLEARNMRGMIYDDLGRRDEALRDFQIILAVDSNFAEAITNRGILHGREGEFSQALGCYDRSLSINPAQPNAFYNRAVVRLVLGDWIRGFQDFESRWKLFPHEAARLTRLAPQWKGDADLAGKTILLHHEQGYGDTLQFCRYAPLVEALGATVLMAVPAGLQSLMTTLPGSVKIISEGSPIPAHDYHCPLMSLPLAFKTTPESVPATTPYLRADPALIGKWRERFSALKRYRVGIVWSGRRFPPINHARDMSLELVRPLLALDVDFVCLHNDLFAQERSELSKHTNVSLPCDELKDFADTAAVIENLDLIITVDSAVGHLAGALGKPVWLMNRFATCWRWLLNRNDSPWYPSLRLFRQPALGDWTRVVRDVEVALQAQRASSSVASPVGAAPSAPGISHDLVELTERFQKALDLHNDGKLEEAVVGYQQILNRWPEQGDVLHYVGVALAQLLRYSDAETYLRRALEVQPTNASLLNHYGNTLAGLSRYPEAIERYDEAIRCDGGLAETHYNRGVALMAFGDREAALEAYARASTLNPTYAQAHNNRGIVLADLRQDEAALQSFDRAIDVAPDFADAWVNRSDLYRRRHQYEEALRDVDRALSLNPDHAEGHNSRGATLADMGRYQDARDHYRRSADLNPASAEAIWNTGLIDLSQGNLAEGWNHYEARWRVKSLKLVPRFPLAEDWDGTESVTGKRVLLHAEQGYGDTLQFCRYASLVAARGARVTLSVPRALTSLLRSIDGLDAVVDQSEVPPFDIQCSLMSLPRVFQTTLASIPTPGQYLKASSDLIERWRHRLLEGHSHLKIGLAWSGRPSHQKDMKRSIPLSLLKPLATCSVDWISLQKEVRSSDQSALSEWPTLRRLGEEMDDFADTAALIANMDLVITVDTAVAHAAGALGKPVWILLPSVADWRWLQERDDSPWYRSARLFRQKPGEGWAPVIQRVFSSLTALANAASEVVPLEET